MPKAVSPLNDPRFAHRTVTVDRSLSPEAAIAATYRNQYVGDSVVASMPQGEGNTVEIIFIRLDTFMNDDGVAKLLTEHGFVAVDPFALAACNAVEPDFTDEHPCFTHWKDAEGKWCCAAFGGSSVRPNVLVHLRIDDWPDFWWVAGVRVRKLS